MELPVTTLRYGVFNIDDYWWVYGAERWSGPFDACGHAVARAKREIQSALAAGLDVELDVHGADGELRQADLASLPRPVASSPPISERPS
jgi:hypothetical protein